MKITKGGMVTPHVLHQELLKCGSLIHRICWHHPEFVRNADSQALLQAYSIRSPRGVAQQFVLLTGPPGQFSCILESHLHLRSWPTPSACDNFLEGIYIHFWGWEQFLLRDLLSQSTRQIELLVWSFSPRQFSGRGKNKLVF